MKIDVSFRQGRKGKRKTGHDSPGKEKTDFKNIFHAYIQSKFHYFFETAFEFG